MTEEKLINFEVMYIKEPKYYSSRISNPAYVIYYDNETRLAVARKGSPLPKNFEREDTKTETYYVGRVNRMSPSFFGSWMCDDVLEFLCIQQQNTKQIWGEISVSHPTGILSVVSDKPTIDLARKLEDEIMAMCTARMGHRGIVSSI